jgi:excisionase family DNA binding protein
VQWAQTNAPTLTVRRIGPAGGMATTDNFGMSAVIATSDAGRLISSKELARLLGVGESTVRRLAAQGKLAGYRVGKQYRFDPAELLGGRVMVPPASPHRSGRGR